MVYHITKASTVQPCSEKSNSMCHVMETSTVQPALSEPSFISINEEEFWIDDTFTCSLAITGMI